MAETKAEALHCDDGGGAQGSPWPWPMRESGRDADFEER